MDSIITTDNIPWPELLGKIFLSTAMQATLGNLELTSRLLIMHFVATQEDADAFINGVQSYMIIGLMWAIGSTFLMYEMHEYFGAGLNLIFQILAMTWIISRRYAVYMINVRKYGLKTKSIFSI